VRRGKGVRTVKRDGENTVDLKGSNKKTEKGLKTQDLKFLYATALRDTEKAKISGGNLVKELMPEALSTIKVFPDSAGFELPL
jgi:hypothetical protein